VKRRRACRVVLAVASACFILTARSAHATAWFVDGGCPTAGTGRSATCGATGPFRTVAQGVTAMQAGDTLTIQGAHGAFDGIYREQLTLANGESSLTPGRALACTQTAPCTIQGSGSPIMRASRRYTDWVDRGGGVYSRIAEMSPDMESTFNRDQYEPETLLLASPTSTLLTFLPYAGDSVASPPDGNWSYNPTTHEVRVNPTGNADPSLIEVPYYQHALLWHLPTQYVTIQDMAFEASRYSTLQTYGSPPDGGIHGLVFRRIRGWYAPRFLIIMTNGAVAPLLEDVDLQYGARGNSQPNGVNHGVYGLRLFMVHGITIRRVHVAHLGTMGRTLAGAPQFGGPFLDPPWNNTQVTEYPEWGHCLNIKQTDGGLVEDFSCEDFASVGIILDVSNGVVVRRTTLNRGEMGLSIRDQTPDGTHTQCYNNSFEDTVLQNIFPPGSPQCAVNTNVNGRNPLVSYSTTTFVGGQPGPSLQFCPSSGTGITISGTGTGGTTTTTTSSPSTTSTSSSTSTIPTTSSTTTTRPTTSTTSTSSSTSSTTTRPPTTTTTTNTVPTTSTTTNTTPTTSSTSTSSSTTTTRPTTTTTPSTSSTTTSRPSTTTTPVTSSTTSSTEPVTTTTLVVGLCGNGILDEGEECDDGNLEALDGCDGSCLLEQIAETDFSRSVSTPIDAPTDPLGTTVLAPTPGDIMVAETSATMPEPQAFAFTRRQVHVHAAPATMAKPLVVRFTVDSSLLPQGTDFRYLQIFRDGALVRPCPRLSRNTVETCLSSHFRRSATETGFTVFTATPGEWNFGVPSGTEPTAASIDRCLGGSKLLIKSNPANSTAKRFLLKSNDASELVVGDGNDAAGLVDGGGSLHVKAVGGDGFEMLYSLSPAGWAPLNPGSPNAGLRYKDPYGPITSVVFKAGLGLQIKGKGPDLVQSLGSEPETIEVELRIGQYRYRFEFGGDARTFTPDKQLVRKWTLRPDCTSPDPVGLAAAK